MIVVVLVLVVLALLAMIDRPRMRPAPRDDSLIRRVMRLEP